MTKVYDVGKTTINHPFGNDLYTLFMVMTGGWFMALFYPHYSSMQLSYQALSLTSLKLGNPAFSTPSLDSMVYLGVTSINDVDQM